MIQLFRWLQLHRALALLRHSAERRGGHERRQRDDRRCEPRSGEAAGSRRFRQRRDIQPSRR